jgi:hypothetical protein
LIANNALERETLRIKNGVLHQVQDDSSASIWGIRKRNRCHRVGALAVGGPLPRILGTSAAGDHVNFVRHHESGIETNTELTNQGRTRAVTLARLDLLQKSPSSRMSDGPKCVDQLVAIHADAIVLNSERFFIGIDGKRDFERGVTAEQGGAGDCFIS